MLIMVMVEVWGGRDQGFPTLRDWGFFPPSLLPTHVTGKPTKNQGALQGKREFAVEAHISPK